MNLVDTFKQLRDKARQAIRVGSDGVQDFADLLLEIQKLAQEIALKLKDQGPQAVDSELQILCDELSQPEAVATLGPFRDLIKQMLLLLLQELLKSRQS